MKKIIVLATTAVIFMIIAHTSFADYGCTNQYGQYGGCTPSQSILIDKTVGKTVTNADGSTSLEYVDNLSASDPRFHAKDIVYFRIRVKNTSDTSVTNVTVTDYLPSYIEPLEGPGTYDGTKRTISWNAGDFTSGEEKVYTLKMQVDSAQYLPADQGLFCIVNKADANNGSVYDSDTAQFCIEKQVVGVTTTPASGPEYGMLVTAASMALGAVGIWMKRKV